MCQIWLRSDGRVEKNWGYRQTDRQTDRQRKLQLYIVDNWIACGAYRCGLCSIIVWFAFNVCAAMQRNNAPVHALA